MSEQEFLENEHKILRAIDERGRKARETGLICKIPKQGEVQTGYIVYLTHSKPVVQAIENYSFDLNHALKGRTIFYGNDYENVHTTVGTYDIQTMPSKSQVLPQLETLCKLSEAVQETMADLKRKHPYLISHGPILEYSGLIHDEGTVVAQPENVGAKDFYELEEIVAQKSSKKEIQLKKSWGRHITVSRVTDDIPAEELDGFNKFMKGFNFIHLFSNSHPLEPLSLNVGYFNLTNGKYNLEKRFNLTPFSAFFF